MGDLGIGEILTAVGSLASVAGTGLGLEAGAEAQNKMNKTLSAEQQWQKGFQKTGQGVLQEHIQEASPKTAKKEMDAGTGDAMQKYQSLQSAPMATASASSVAPSVSNAVVGDDSKARGNILNQAAAPIQGLQDWQAQQWIDELKAKTTLNQNNQFAERLAGTLPANLNAAQHSEDTMGSIGSLLNTLGGVAGVFGQTRGKTSKPSPTIGWQNTINNPNAAWGNPVPLS